MIGSRSHLPSIARTATVIDVVPYIKTQSVHQMAQALNGEVNGIEGALPGKELTAYQILPEISADAHTVDAGIGEETEETAQSVCEMAQGIMLEPVAIDTPITLEEQPLHQVCAHLSQEINVMDIAPESDEQSDGGVVEANVIDITPQTESNEGYKISPQDLRAGNTIDVISTSESVDEQTDFWGEDSSSERNQPTASNIFYQVESSIWEEDDQNDRKSNRETKIVDRIEQVDRVEDKTIDVTPIEETHKTYKIAREDVQVGQAIDIQPTMAHQPVQRAVEAQVASNTTIDVTPVNDNPLANQTNNHQSQRSGELVKSEGNFSTFLAPLNKDSFKRVVTDVEDKLKVVNQTLTMLTHSEGFDAILQDMLNAITLKTGELLNADRTTIYLVDEEKNELWSIVAKDEKGQSLEIRFPATQGIAGEVATFRKSIKIPYDFYNDPRSAFAQMQDKRNGYRTYTMLVLPLLNDNDELVAVVQLINKLKTPGEIANTNSLAERIDWNGFTEEDERVFEEFAPSIRLILESSKSFYVATQRQRAADALIKANQALSQSSLDLEDTLKRVMDEAKKLMNADRSTLWLIDHDRNELWTKIPIGGVLKEIRIPRTAGFAGLVAETGEPLMIPFDLYDDPRSETSKQTDQKLGYRTCSMLCMPVFNADGNLIGVTQLINKKKQGEHPPYDANEWPKAPECWRSSFNRTDLEFMQIFNIQAGVALQNAKLFAEVKRQQQMQRDILRSLSNGVISTDKAGNVIAANESAKKLLGFCEDDKLEGKPVYELVRIKGKEETDEDKFAQWFKTALNSAEEKKRQQYYPDQLLESADSQQHTVNLSINAIADAIDSTKVDGVLVVMDDISDEKRLKSTMYRYMTQEVAEKLLESGETKLGGNRKQVTVLFSDIRSYTTLTESMQAEEVVQMLNEYFESMVDAVFRYKGTLDKYIGDAIMAVFGAFVPLEDHAWMAAQTAVEMRHRLSAFNEKRRLDSKQEIKIGIGINSDEVISGNIGSSQRMELTSIGDGVNLGSRLEGASKQYGCDIVISENTFRLCGEHRIWHRELDYIRVKGKTQPVSIFELVGLQGEVIPDEKKKVIEIYHLGRKYYLEKKFRQAMNEFATILEDMNIADKAASLYLKRCQYWLDNPEAVESEWDDGVWTLTDK